MSVSTGRRLSGAEGSASSDQLPSKLSGSRLIKTSAKAVPESTWLMSSKVRPLDLFGLSLVAEGLLCNWAAIAAEQQMLLSKCLRA